MTATCSNLSSMKLGRQAANIAGLCSLQAILFAAPGIASVADTSPIAVIDHGIYETRHRDNATQDRYSPQAERLGVSSSSDCDRMVVSTSDVCARPTMTFGVEVYIQPASLLKLVRLEATCVYPDQTGKKNSFSESKWMDTVDVYHTHFFGCEVEPRDRSGIWHVRLGYEGRTIVDQTFHVELHCGDPIS